MSKPKHKARVPWWHLRRRLRETRQDLDQLTRQHRAMSEQWAADRLELERLRETYEPLPVTAPEPVRQTRPVPSWADQEADPAATQQIPVVAVGVDPSSTDPTGITVIAVDSRGNMEVINSES